MWDRKERKREKVIESKKFVKINRDNTYLSYQ
jgi:hypothetical protein